MEYYSAIKRNAFESVLVRSMNLEPVIQSGISQKTTEENLSKESRKPHLPLASVSLVQLKLKKLSCPK